MAAIETIKYVLRRDIDQQLWDKCIDEAPNGLVYGYTAYLDCMADQWDGLVLNNYEAVMPLPFRKKFGIAYIYQPFLTAQLGIFGNGITSEMVKAFLDNIPSRYRLWEFSMNHHNLFTDTGYNIYPRTNYVLPLEKTYNELSGAYREQTKRNSRKSVQYGCYVQKDIPVKEVMNLAEGQNGKDEGFDHFEHLYNDLYKNGKAVCYGVYTSDQMLVASCALLYSHNRIYYILVGNHPNGRTLGASHAMIDHIIRDHAGSGLLLDFEGSDHRNLAFFYSSFGAKEEIYAAIRMNRLPWYARIFKS